MAIPTITSVDPSGGLTIGGNIVKVLGTNFRLPDAPPTTGYLGGEQQKTVSVKFDGQESEWAYSATSGMIMVRVPEYRGPSDVAYPIAADVRVANLDNNGDEIPTENVTSVGAYGFQRPNIAAESYLQRVVRELSQMFKRHILANTHLMYSTTGAGENFDDTRLQAETPSLALVGPLLDTNRFYSVNQETEGEDPSNPDGWIRMKRPVTQNIDFDLLIYASTQRHLIGLMQAVLLHFRDQADLRVDNYGDDPSQGYKEYEIEMPWTFSPGSESKPNKNNLFVARARVSIIGVHIDTEDGTILERGWNVDDEVLDVQGN